MKEQNIDSPLIYLPEQGDKKVDFMEKFENILKLNLDGVKSHNKWNDSSHKVGFDRVLSNDKKTKNEKPLYLDQKPKQVEK